MLNQSDLVSFFNHYHSLSKRRPSLYKNDKTQITVVLPASMLEYANAAAGHSGFGAGARPVGIRREVEDSNQALNDIFSSVDSLRSFIESSECDYKNVSISSNSVIKRSSKSYKVSPVKGVNSTLSLNRTKVDEKDLAKNMFFKVFPTSEGGAILMKSLVQQYGKEEVTNCWEKLTIDEFRIRYSI